MSDPGFIPPSTVTPQSFGTNAGTDENRSFNKLINVRSPYDTSEENSLDRYASYIQLYGCTPGNVSVTKPYAYYTFQLSSIFYAAFKVRNITKNVYNTGKGAVIDVVVAGGTSSTAEKFQISIDAGTPATGTPTTVTNVNNATFSNLGGALVVVYDVSITELTPTSGPLCPAVFTITLQTGPTVAASIKLKSTPGVPGKVTGQVYPFSNPVVVSGFSSTVTLYNASV